MAWDVISCDTFSAACFIKFFLKKKKIQLLINIRRKTALIIIFISPMDQIISCNMKGVTGCDEPTENYHPTLQFPSVF